MAEVGTSHLALGKRKKTAHPNPPNVDQEKYMSVLNGKEIVSTKFFDWYALEDLGIDRLTSSLLCHAGFVGF